MKITYQLINCQYVIAGSFLIPYTTCTVLIAWPIAYVQLKVGGAAQKGVVGIMASQIPILKGKTSYYNMTFCFVPKYKH